MSLQTYTREYNRCMNAPRATKEQETTLYLITAAVIIALGFGCVFFMFITAAARQNDAPEYYQATCNR